MAVAASTLMALCIFFPLLFARGLAKVYGKGRASGQHLGTHIWLKIKNVLVAAMEEEAAGKALKDIRELRKRFAKEGIKAFMWEVEDVTP